MNRISMPLLGLALCLAMLAGCPSRPPSTPTGSLQLTVSMPQGLGAAVSRVTVTASAEDFPPVSAELRSTDGVWGGLIDDLPADVQLTFLARAFDASGTQLLEGSASSVTLTAEEMSLVAITLQRVAPPLDAQNAPPVIDALVTPSTSVPPGGALSLVATAHDPNPDDSLTYAWTATEGSFSSTTTASTSWTAPASTGPQTLTLTVTDSHGASASASLTLTVTPNSTRGSARVTLSFNSFPQVSSVLATLSRLDLFQTTSVSVSARDEDGDSLTYAWTESPSCWGSWEQDSSSTARFTPYTRPTEACDNCNLTVTVSDGRGGKGTGSVNLCVTAAAAPQVFNPIIVTASRSGDMNKATSVFTFEVVASDPQGSWLSFSWATNSGQLGSASFENGIGHVDWTAPACFRPSQPPLIFATITNNSGLTATQRFEMRGLPVRTCAAEWSQTHALAEPRNYHAAATLPGGKVLVSGGERDYSALMTAEVYDSTTGLWSATSPMASTRDEHTATPLPGGRVLVSGGRTRFGSLATAEVYDPATGTWSATGSMASPRHGHTATPLPGGKVLIAGGQRDYSALTTAEVYDPATGTWSATGSLVSTRLKHTATPLPGGKVLIVGGQVGDSPIATAEVYDPATGTWRATGSMASPRYQHAAAPLPGGKVLITGGFNSSGVLATAAVYDPATGTWRAASSMASPRFGHTATPLSDGKVLVAGGSYPSGTSEVYDPAKGTWKGSTSMSGSPSGHTATLLPDGTVLVSGGFSRGSPLTGAELYVP